MKSKGSKATRLTESEKKRILAYYHQGNSMAVCAKKFKRSISSIKKAIDSYENTNFANELKEIKRANDEELLNLFKNDNRVNSIIDKMLNIVNDEKTLAQVVADKGIQQFTAFIGMSVDKVLAIKNKDGDGMSGEVLQTNDGFDDAVKKALTKLDPISMLDEASK